MNEIEKSLQIAHFLITIAVILILIGVLLSFEMVIVANSEMDKIIDKQAQELIKYRSGNNS